MGDDEDRGSRAAGGVGVADVAVGPHGDQDRGWGLLTLIAAASSLFVVSAVLATMSLSETPDTPCGSVLSPNFVYGRWDTNTQCGLVHLGTGLTAGWLALTGVVMLLVGWLASRGRLSSRVVVLLVSGSAVAALLVTCWLVWRAAPMDEPVMRRGWMVVRNVAVSATVCLAVVGVIVAAGERYMVGGRRRT